MLACSGGFPDIVLTLIGTSNVDLGLISRIYREHSGYSALHMAVLGGNLQVLLLSAITPASTVPTLHCFLLSTLFVTIPYLYYCSSKVLQLLLEACSPAELTATTSVSTLSAELFYISHPCLLY
jgi:hypothetical protein